ncbi:hypothetical protein LEN26_000869 [Aphanomyces euteiches]|nr:hypothetical protein AeMF1_011744 [Aphanomyces euteiches]KAH9162612.1 hypothetical protein LEN26_000869 [Aphanomyces euteiches]KAH9191601.1 hypothetical protein AeNC1_006418 [Aphanomyces euteiches]
MNVVKEDVEKDKSDLNSGVAGAIRSTLRSMFPGLTINRPIFRPPRVPIKDRAAVMHGVVEAAQDPPRTTATKEQSFFRRQVTQALSLLRSSVLGFLTWTTYDIASQVLSGRQEVSSVGSKMAISIAAGGTAGAIHGYLWGRSETFFSRYSSRYLACHAHGVMISHGCSHTAMFASYEGMKTYLIYDEQWDAPMSIVVAGAISGVVVDIVAHFAAPFEHYPMKVALKQLQHVKMPSVSEMSKSAGATLLGWIAYESAKEQLEMEGRQF